MHFKSWSKQDGVRVYFGFTPCAWPSEMHLNPVLQLPAVDATTGDGSNCNSQKMLPTLDTDIEDLTGKSLMDM